MNAEGSAYIGELNVEIYTPKAITVVGQSALGTDMGET